jgi:hypothetical protein
MSSGSIIVGLNGALQKRFLLSPQTSLVPGNVHRATTIQTGVGGKGQDVAISLACLGLADDDDTQQQQDAVGAIRRKWSRRMIRFWHS